MTARRSPRAPSQGPRCRVRRGVAPLRAAMIRTSPASTVTGAPPRAPPSHDREQLSPDVNNSPQKIQKIFASKAGGWMLRQRGGQTDIRGRAAGGAGWGLERRPEAFGMKRNGERALAGNLRAVLRP